MMAQLAADRAAEFVREAGGLVTDLGGDDAVLRHGLVVAGNFAIHRWLLGILQAVPNA